MHLTALRTSRPSPWTTAYRDDAGHWWPHDDLARVGRLAAPARFAWRALPAAGTYRWALVVDAPGLQDRHDLGTTTVFADEAAALASAEREPAGDPTAIAYLKEQQWTSPFATAIVSDARAARGDPRARAGGAARRR